MRKNLWLKIVLLALLLQNSLPTFASGNTTAFSQSSTGIYFNGASTSNIEVPANSNFDIGCQDFTISWWQKAPKFQDLYPRLFQFGYGTSNSDGFAVSEEDGKLYFWMNESQPPSGVQGKHIMFDLPDAANLWNHFAIVKNGAQFYIYLNGVSQQIYENSITSITCAPPTLENLPLLIGGSDESSLGGFRGEITGFEILKGAKWVTSNFTPPTEFSTERFQQCDMNNVCSLESVLLIYPSENFVTSSFGLTNLIDGTPITFDSAITFGDQSATPTPTPTFETYDVNLSHTQHGEICLTGTNDVEVCNTQDDQIVTIRKDSHPFLYIYPDSGYEVESILITPLGASTVTSTSLNYDIPVEDSNGTEFLFEPDYQGFNLPHNFSEFQVQVNFRLIELSEVLLVNTSYGDICLDDYSTATSLCSNSSNDQIVNILRNNSELIRIFPDPHFRFKSATITPARADSVTSISNEDNFLVTDEDGQNYIFTWNWNGDLVIPEDMSDFDIFVTFERIPGPSLISESMETSGPHYFNDYYPLEISSVDPATPNDYSGVQSILLDIQYFPNNPLDPSASSVKSFCRNYVNSNSWFTTNLDDVNDNGIENDALIVWLPSTYSEFLIDCLGYHQTSEITHARLLFFNTPEVDQADLNTLDLSTAMQSVAIQIISPPGIESMLTSSNVKVNDKITFEASNIDSIRGFSLLFLSQHDFIDGYCDYYVNIIDEDGNIIPNYLNQEGNIILNMPSYSEINSYCGGLNSYYDSYYDESVSEINYFNQGVDSINPFSDYIVKLQVYDKYWDLDYKEGEIATELTLKAAGNSISSIESDLNPNPKPTPSPNQQPICSTSKTININFDGGSSVLKESANKKIREIIYLIKLCSYKNIKVTGYTSIDKPDSPGYKLFRKNLSLARARVVKLSISRKMGVDVAALKYTISGKSELNAIKSNSSEKTRSANRRVEVRLKF